MSERTPEISQQIEIFSQETLGKISASIDQLNSGVRKFYKISYLTHVAEEKQTGVVNGRVVLYKERGPQPVPENLLISGAVAARQGVKISNPEVLETEGLEIFAKAVSAVSKLQIDFDSQDNGYRIQFEKLQPDEQDQVKNTVLEVLEEACPENGSIDIKWLTHNRYSPEHGRNLKPQQVRISRNVDGQLRFEEDPQKKLSILPLESAYALKPLEGTEASRLEEIVSDKGKGYEALSHEEARAYGFYKTIQNGVRTVILEQIYSNSGLASSLEYKEPWDGLAAKAKSLFDEFPKCFSDLRETIEAKDGLVEIFKGIVNSGVWVFRPEFVGDDLANSDTFLQKLSQLPPSEAQELVLLLAHGSDYYLNIKLPSVDQPRNGSGNAKKAADKKETGTNKQDNHVSKIEFRYHEIMGIPPEVDQASVIGVATVLGLIENNKIFTSQEKEKLDGAERIIYGTTDFANPVEAIMLAEASKKPDGSRIPAFYEADGEAHSVGSYLQRILIPTVSLLSDLSETEQQRLYDVAKSLDNHDYTLDELSSSFHSDELDQYLQELAALTGGSTFAQIYKSLNQKLCEHVGIDFRTSREYLEETKLTVGEVMQYSQTIATASKEKYDSMKKFLEESGFEQKYVDGSMQNVWGAGGAWNANSRQFFRLNHGDESEVVMENIDPNTKLSDLPNDGVTLGGNAWVVAMQLSAENKGQNTVVAHKNTKLGLNYCAPLLAGDRVRASISPIVRVVPDGRNKITGDGMDIGMYFACPQLINLVQEAFNSDDPLIIIGQRKIVIQIEKVTAWIGGEQQTALIAGVATEPLHGGKRKHLTSVLI